MSGESGYAWGRSWKKKARAKNFPPNDEAGVFALVTTTSGEPSSTLVIG
jgi:hypothetical protein